MYIKFGLNGHIQCLIVRYDTCKVDGDSCVNTPVVIFFVEQMLLVQEIQFRQQIIVRTGILIFSEVFLGNSYDGKGSFSSRSQNRRTLLLPPC